MVDLKVRQINPSRLPFFISLARLNCMLRTLLSKGVMEDIFEQDKEDTLTPADKESCQKLLLMVSVKEKIFSKEQRNTAKKLLARLEGDRRRKCRVSEGGDRTDRRSLGHADEPANSASTPKELLIVSSKKKRKRGTPRKGDDGASGKSTPRRESDIDEDGFKVTTLFSFSVSLPSNCSLKSNKLSLSIPTSQLHSDDEADWSDTEDANAKSISLKEAQRRREWGHGKDEMAAAALPWPVFPRNAVSNVLKTLLDEVIKIDEDAGGMFSVPVPKDQFPDYYELIETPVSHSISHSIPNSPLVDIWLFSYHRLS